MKIVSTLLLSALCVVAFAPAMPQSQITTLRQIPTKKNEHIGLIQRIDSIANRIKLTNSNIITSIKKIENENSKKPINNNVHVGNGLTFRTNARY
jgi:predicted PurR-regulated permease PerM